MRKPIARFISWRITIQPRHSLSSKEAVYGLPELHREQIASAQLIANPGCYATSIILALAPLIHEKRIDLRRGIVCDSKSGVSGAGKTPTAKTHFMNAADNLSAYSVFNHRHIGEMLEQLGLKAKDIIFTPHLLPIPRGIFSTVYVNLQKRTSARRYRCLFSELLCRFSDGAMVGRTTAGNSILCPDQLLRSRICVGE